MQGRKLKKNRPPFLPKMYRILQINTNRSRTALDISLATALKLQADIILLSEPNKAKMVQNTAWITDDRIDAGIIILNKNLEICNHGRGDGYCYITTKEAMIFSCYSSGNRDQGQHLDSMLDEIHGHIRNNKGRCIVAGDFNAKSAFWGMNRTDSRGNILEEWIAENDTILLNEEGIPTFQSESYTSVLDLTFITPDLKELNHTWEVLDEESLSDHRFVFFTIGKQSPAHKTTTKIMGWQTNKIEMKRLLEESSGLTWETEITAGNFTNKLKDICNATMPIRSNTQHHKPVYWWNTEIANKRKECLQKRRSYTRLVKKSPLAICVQLWDSFQNARKILRTEIKKSKRTMWKKLCDEIDKDIWGDGYKIAMKNVIGYTPRPPMTIKKMEDIVQQIFIIETPTNLRKESLSVITDTHPVIENCDNDVMTPTDPVIPNCDTSSVSFTDFSLEELSQVCSKIKTRKAPGPKKIPPEILKATATNSPEYVLNIYNKLARRGEFPSQWKIAKLVLLPKGKGSSGEPTSFRPLSLLDSEGKLYEMLIADRLEKEIERTGGLSDNQFGFRKGRQTTDAILKIFGLAEEAWSYSWKYRRLCVVITLDVKNAFNCASWQQIIEVMQKREINEGLVTIVNSYLSERRLLLEAEDEDKIIDVKGGVPQGSILGPMLWNLLYDDLFRMVLPNGVTSIGFADDVALVVVAKSPEDIMYKGNMALRRVSEWMATRQLALAPHKTEAVLLTTKRKVGEIKFQLDGEEIKLNRSIKYLGIWMDTKLTFAEQVKQVIEKASRTISALTRVMPNIGGPRASKRRLLSSVVHSQILYATPAWHGVTKNKKLIGKLRSLQRTLNIRICSAYRSVSFAASGVIAGIPPIELMIQERRQRYLGIAKTEARKTLTENWQKYWDENTSGRWTYSLIPDVKTWWERPYGEVDFYLTQALSGHGCFNKYLHGKNRSATPECRYCDEEDDAHHTLFECVRWASIREQFEANTGEVFNVGCMRRKLTAKKEEWITMYKIVREIIEGKEKEERAESSQR